MPDPDGSALLTKCDEELPLLGVTREFDFGQFIELFDSSPDPNNPKAPPTVARVVIEPTATLATERDSASKSVQRMSSPLTAAPAAEGSAQEVHLFSLTEHGPAAKMPPQPVLITERDAFFSKGNIDVAGRAFRVRVDSELREALSKGLTVTSFATPTKAGEDVGKVLVNLSLPFERVSLDEQSIYRVLAGGTVNMPSGKYKPVLDDVAVRALLQGQSVFTHATGDADASDAPIQVQSSKETQHLLQRSFEVFDLAQFLVKPRLLGASGEFVDATVPAESVEQLLKFGKGQAQWQGGTVELTLVDDSRIEDLDEFRQAAPMLTTFGDDSGYPPVKPPGVSWQEILKLASKFEKSPHFVHPSLKIYTGKGPGGIYTGVESIDPPYTYKPRPASMTDKVQPRLPSGTGLPVAVFVPWKQSWTLKGFSRGNLLHSIALAPLEQVTLQVFSWERRLRSLEQSSETELEQATETTQTTRDTEDVFREMIAKHDFAWQLSGSLDASYSNGVASIQVGVDGEVSDTTSIEQTARNSSQHVQESSIKASARVRSKRVTRITQTVESGREERVTRLIRNPNQCHTLTLDFFEALAHYEIKLEFLPDRLRLVVLVPNSVQTPDFSSEIVRRNETTLRNALIEPALVDGFDACRTVASYDEAKKLVLQQQAEAAKSEEVNTQRDQPAPTAVTDPAAPQQAEVARIVNAMVAAVKQIHAESDVDPAMVAIRDHKPVTEAMRRKGQYWLFINFAAAKFPAIITTLDQLSGAQGSVIEDAQKLLSVLPKADTPTNLGNVNQISDGEKESAGIASKIKQGYMKSSWDWAWWTGRMREEALYTANDAGLGGFAEQLGRAYKDWEAKKAQGAAMKDQDVTKTEAEGKQDKATADDKLAMAFPLDELARAYERQKVLRDHLNDHREFYNFALFQAMPPSEQALRIIEASNGRLQVGVFEPRAVAMNGSRLAVPLTPLAGSPQLQAFVASLKETLATTFRSGGGIPIDKAILPTPGVTVSSRLGKCSACEEYIETARRHELGRLEALTQQEQWEAARRQKRIEDKENYDDFRESPPAVKLEVESKTPPPP